jgi:hypothetical protein
MRVAKTEMVELGRMWVRLDVREESEKGRAWQLDGIGEALCRIAGLYRITGRLYGITGLELFKGIGGLDGFRGLKDREILRGLKGAGLLRGPKGAGLLRGLKGRGCRRGLGPKPNRHRHRRQERFTVLLFGGCVHL